MFGSGFSLLLRLNYLTVHVTLQHLQTMQSNWLAYIYIYVYISNFFTCFFLIFLHQVCTRVTCRIGISRNVLTDTVERL